jgi:hypothetical protein
MTLLASDRRMLAGEWELCLAVIERRARPLYGRVACVAGGGEARGLVIGIRRGVVIVDMASGAILRRAGEAIVGMALAAGDCRVLAGEHELGGRVVIELRALPLRRGMARLAGCGEPGRLVVRIRRAVISGEVTRRTLRR